MYLLDTNACIRLLNGTSPELVRNLKERGASQIRLCSVVRAELEFGACKSSRPAENLRLVEEFCAPFPSFPFDDASAAEYGRIRADLERQGRPIGPNDLMIASIALANRLVLVTHNTDEFARVSGLRLEDWED